MTPQQQLGMQMGTLGANMVVEGFRQLFSRPAVDPVQEQNQIAARQYNDMGIWNLRQKNYAMAITEFERALGRTPNDQSIVANLTYAKQLMEQSRKDAAAAAQISGALGNLLGDVPARTGGFDFTAPARSGASIPNASALYFLNLFTDPSVVDLRGTTKTAVDQADLKGQLDALFANRAPVAASGAPPVQLPNDKDIELLYEVLGAPASGPAAPGAAVACAPSASTFSSSAG